MAQCTASKTAGPFTLPQFFKPNDVFTLYQPIEYSDGTYVVLPQTAERTKRLFQGSRPTEEYFIFCTDNDGDRQEGEWLENNSRGHTVGQRREIKATDPSDNTVCYFEVSSDVGGVNYLHNIPYWEDANYENPTPNQLMVTHVIRYSTEPQVTQIV